MSGTGIPLGITAFKRSNAHSPELLVQNRFYEKNPWNQQEQVALIRRPALRPRTTVGAGPIRRMSYQSGAMLNDMFVISGPDLYRVHKSITGPDTVTHITGVIAGASGYSPEIVITSSFVFIADGATLQWTDGVAPLAAVATPDGVPIATIDYLSSFVLCGVGNSDKFYWIEPAANTIDPLNFATAERLPDWINNIRSVGDQAWMLGKKTSEVWYPTGDPNAPWQRAQGRLFDQGIWQGTAVKVNESVIVVGEDGIVYDIMYAPIPVSTPGITEQIRKTMHTQEYTGG